jgi:phytoene dehydrogenase-like protein
MTNKYTYDAIVVGSGPNGLAAAVTLAQEGLSVVVFEAKSTIGGGTRSAELTLPGFIHDVCSAIHPLGLGSPFFRALPLAKHGLEWIHPLAPLAHPFDDGTAAVLEHSIDATGRTLDGDGTAYRRLIEPLVANWEKLNAELLGPLHLPRHPVEMAQFGLHAIRSASGLAKSLFKGEHARGFFAGLAAHSIMPLDRPLTAAFGLILCILGHSVGWPMPRGGSQRIADALASYFRSLGGEIVTGVCVDSIDKLPSTRAVLFDVTPRQLLQIAGHRLPSGYRAKLKGYRYGPGAFKVDWALRAPIPWKAEECSRAGTVHIGGTLEEITKSEREVWEGKYPENPMS